MINTQAVTPHPAREKALNKALLRTNFLKPDNGFTRTVPK
jgi:hypothetical protein